MKISILLLVLFLSSSFNLIFANNDYQTEHDKGYKFMNEHNYANAIEHIKNAITDIANKQRNMIKEWEDAHPNWEGTDKGRDEYIKIVQSAMKDVSDSPTENKIIKNIVKETVVSKEILSDK